MDFRRMFLAMLLTVLATLVFALPVLAQEPTPTPVASEDAADEDVDAADEDDAESDEEDGEVEEVEECDGDMLDCMMESLKGEDAEGDGDVRNALIIGLLLAGIYGLGRGDEYIFEKVSHAFFDSPLLLSVTNPTVAVGLGTLKRFQILLVFALSLVAVHKIGWLDIGEAAAIIFPWVEEGGDFSRVLTAVIATVVSARHHESVHPPKSQFNGVVKTALVTSRANRAAKKAAREQAQTATE